MESDFSAIFHQSSKNRFRGHSPIPLDHSEWPDSWKTIEYKTYPRLPRVPLPDESPSADLFMVLQTRRSRRDFLGKPISLRELGTLLKYACGERSDRRRMHPSGGARFPIETYPLVLQDSGQLPAGVYHYNVRDHVLDTLQAGTNFDRAELKGLLGLPWMLEAGVCFVLTAIFDRNQRKYGERGYRHVLLEAGHISQNFYLVGEALNLKILALAATNDEPIERLIGIDGVTESLVYALLAGK